VGEPLDVEGLIASSQGLFTWLAMAAANDPERLAARGLEGGDVVDVTLAGLETRSRQLAKGLESIGVTPGSTVALWIPNRVEWLVAQFACSALGVAVLGLNTRYRSHEVSHLLDTVALSAIILPSEFLGIDFVGTLDQAVRNQCEINSAFTAPSLVFLGEIPAAASALTSSSFRYQELTAKGAQGETEDHGLAPSNLFTTSGSTSAPKVAGHNQTSILRHAYAGSKALGVHAGDRILAVLPLCGVFGFNAVMALLVGGGSALLVESFDAEVGARYLGEFDVTHVVGGDEMLGAIFSKVPPGTELARLRRGGIANFAGRAKEVVAQAQERWGAAISGVYGSSELFALSAIWPASADVATRGLGGGVVVDPGIHVRVRDLDTDAPVGDGESGELQFRGYNVIEGYLNNPRANESSFTSDGWFKTGDLGYVANGGFVYQCRAREALRLRGFLVEPGEIEDFLSLDPSIDEVHVVGVDTDSGTRAFAFARPRPGSSIDEAVVLAWARKQLASFKVPERIIAIEEFPTTAGTNGTKVRFEELRDMARVYLATPS
jgi:acyl-CoA synthetase (AMP-forming)/AMP-acid ligase II